MGSPIDSGLEKSLAAKGPGNRVPGPSVNWGTATKGCEFGFLSALAH
jgi:hypothetical protein